MKSASLVVWIVSAMLPIVFVPTSAVMALPIDQARQAIADRLVTRQDTDGSWPDEVAFTGSIVAGMVSAYEVVEKAEYMVAAKLGGIFILISAEGNFYGEEAYALVRLTEITGDTTYADAVRNFYDGLDTNAYILGYLGTEPSNAVFYIAHHAVAAHKVGARDAGVWRQGLIDFLFLVNDDIAYYPVMGLGVATWALAQTGPLDETKLDPFSQGNVTLSDLPGILVSHMVTTPSEGVVGTFYHRFDHTPAGGDSEASGYTEDTIYGLLGLMAAASPERDFYEEISSSQEALCSSVLSDGIVYEHIYSGWGVHVLGEGAELYTYCGEMLQAISPVNQAVSTAANGGKDTTTIEPQ